MARRPYVMTPARAAALRKAQLASARARKKRTSLKRRRYSSDPVKRGQGVAGLQKNLTPYARVSKRSQTVGFNTGTIIPFTKKRVAFGTYFRVEGTNKKNSVDKFITSAGNKIARPGTKPGAVRSYLAKNVVVENPGIRANIAGTQVRLGSSRGSGASLIIRRGKHKTTLTRSRSGLKKYNRRMRTISKKKSRRQRRGRRKS